MPGSKTGELEDFLSEESKERIDNAITQSDWRSSLPALAGLREVPTYLASTGLSDSGERPNPVVAEIRDGVETLTSDYHVVFDTAGFQVRVPETTAETRAKFLVKIPVSILTQLMGTTRIPDVIAELSRAQAVAPWEIHSAEGFAELNTPLGFGFRLEVELGR